MPADRLAQLHSRDHYRRDYCRCCCYGSMAIESCCCVNMTQIKDIVVRDIRFPTSNSLDGSDAMNLSPNYSAAYVVLKTDGDDEGHGLTFTIGRGNELCVAAIEALKPLVVGLTIQSGVNMGDI